MAEETHVFTPICNIYKSVCENHFDLKNEKEFKTAFSYLDVDKDGVISRNDLSIIATEMDGKAPDEMNLSRMLTNFDVNEDGVISFHEFVATVKVNMENFMKWDDFIDWCDILFCVGAILES